METERKEGGGEGRRKEGKGGREARGQRTEEREERIG